MTVEQLIEALNKALEMEGISPTDTVAIAVRPGDFKENIAGFQLSYLDSPLVPTLIVDETEKETMPFSTMIFFK